MAARIISGAEIASRKTCRENVFSAGDAVTKGPRPAKASDRDSPAMTNRQTHNPPGPKRTAAHSSNGIGVRSSAGTFPDAGATLPKTRKPTASSAIVRRPSSA